MGSTRTTTDGVTDTLQMFQMGGTHPQAGLVTSDGTRIQLTSEGLEIDGEFQPMLTPGLAAASGSQAFAQLISDYKQLDRTARGAALAGRLLGPLMAYLGLKTAILGDGGVATRLGGVSSAASGFQTGLEALGTQGIASKTLGFVGGGIATGLGIYELTQHNYAEGAVDILAGGAAMVGVFFPPALWVAAAATVARVILDIGDSNGPDHAPLVIS